MKKKKYLTFISLIMIPTIVLLITFINILHTKAAEKTVYNVDISTSPKKGFLIADNMAPGDKKTTIIKVINNGKLNFKYSVSSRQESGDINFLNEIHLTISDQKEKLYDGQLKGLSQFPLGMIKKSGSSELTFTAELPLNVGNEVQGKKASVAFDFTAIGNEESTPVSGSNLPDTGTNMFNLILTGTGLLFVGVTLQLVMLRRRKIGEKN